MERVSQAFLFHEALAADDEGASLEESLEQVLWYYPINATQTERVRHVGLAQALLSFAGRFEQGARSDDGNRRRSQRSTGNRTNPGSVRTVRTKHHCHGFVECEPGIWLVMVIKNRAVAAQNEEHPRERSFSTTPSTAPAFFTPPKQKPSAPSAGSRFRTAVFGRAAGTASLSRPSSAERGVPIHRLSGNFSLREGSYSDYSRNTRGVDGGSPHDWSGSGGFRTGRNSTTAGGAGEDWVDETSLRAAMTTAYETFRLLNGPMQRMLDAPVQCHQCRWLGLGKKGVGTAAATEAEAGVGLPLSARSVSETANDVSDSHQLPSAFVNTGCVEVGRSRCSRESEASQKYPDYAEGADRGDGSRVVLPGGEVLKRLACARKRLRKARREMAEAPPEEQWLTAEDDQHPETEIPAPTEEGTEADGNASSELELLQRRVTALAGEISSLLRLSPAQRLREKLSGFFDVYLPGAGLSQPHFHLDMGYPQSLPMDSYRRQLGLRMQRRLRDRIRAKCRRRRLQHLKQAGTDNLKIRDESISILLSIAGGALLLACSTREHREQDSISNTTARQNLQSGRKKVAEFDGRTNTGAGTVPENDPNTNVGSSLSSSDDAFFGGRGANLLLGYLSAAASVAASPEGSSCNVAGRATARGGFARARRTSISSVEGVLQGGGNDGASTVMSRQKGVAEDGVNQRLPGVKRADAGLIPTSSPSSPPKAPTSPSWRSPGELWKAWRENDANDSVEDSRDAATNNGGYRTVNDPGVSTREEGVNGTGRLERGASWMSRGAKGGLLCRNGALATCDRRIAAVCGGDDDDHQIWAPQLHDASGEQPRRVVVYLRGGLCAMVAFEERQLGLEEYGVHPPEEEGGTQEATPGGVRVADKGVGQSELLALGRSIEACLVEDPDLAVLEDDALDLYSQTVNAPTWPPHSSSSSTRSRSNTAGGSSSSSMASSGAGFGAFRGKTFPGKERGPIPDGVPIVRPPLHKVHYSISPVSCFAGAGLVHPPPPPPSTFTPTLPSRSVGDRSGERSPARTLDDDNDGFEAVNVSPVFAGRARSFSPTIAPVVEIGRPPDGVSSSFPPSPTDGRSLSSGNVPQDGVSTGDENVCAACGDDRGVPCRDDDDALLRLVCSVGGQQGEGFKALVEAFSRRGRADIGVEELLRGRPSVGGRQQLSALDDMHASLRNPRRCMLERTGWVGNDPTNGSENHGNDSGREEATKGDDERWSSLEYDKNKDTKERARTAEVVNQTRLSSQNEQQQQQQHGEQNVVSEIGLRTSMSKGNRWVIGRRIIHHGEPERDRGKTHRYGSSNPDKVAAFSGSSGLPDHPPAALAGKSDGDGEMFAMIDAPILSVGDARAAAEKVFSRSGDSSGSGGDGAGVGGGSFVRDIGPSSRTMTSRLRF